MARAHFLTEEGDLESAQLRLRPTDKKPKDGLISELEGTAEAMKNLPWTALQEMKGNASVLEKIGNLEELLKSLRKALSD